MKKEEALRIARGWLAVIAGALLALLLGALVWIHIDERASRHVDLREKRPEQRFIQDSPLFPAQGREGHENRK